MRRILVVDDEESIRELIKEKLEQSKYEVTTVASGKEVLDIYKTSQPDLILMDIAMPEMDGYQTAEELRKDPEAQNIPILFLTGKDLEEESIIERCKGIAKCGYIPKMFTLEEMLDRIKEYL